MVNFRWHRGSLEESMKTSIAISDFSELYLLIKNALYGSKIEVKQENIEIKDYGFDSRLPSKTYIVILKECGVLGFIDGDWVERILQSDKA